MKKSPSKITKIVINERPVLVQYNVTGTDMVIEKVTTVVEELLTRLTDNQIEEIKTKIKSKVNIY